MIDLIKKNIFLRLLSKFTDRQLLLEVIILIPHGFPTNFRKTGNNLQRESADY